MVPQDAATTEDLIAELVLDEYLDFRLRVDLPAPMSRIDYLSGVATPVAAARAGSFSAAAERLTK
jgi:hypothetical protein